MYEICDNEIKEESESHSIQARWSHKSNVAQVSSVQSYRPSLVRQFYSSHLKTWIPWSLHLSQRNHGEDIGDSVKDIAQWVCMRGLADKMAIPR